jgi:type I restriction enzyme S subunit
MLRVGDIVVATSSGSKHLVGKTAQVRDAWAGSFGAFCAALRPKVDIDHRYLGYFFGSKEYKDYITKKALGVNINNLRRGDLEQISVPVAPLDQQKRIVAEIEKQFSRLDEAVANLKRVKANLKRYKAAVLKAAVEGRLVETEAELARKKTPSPLAGEGGGEGANYETGEQLLQRILEIRRSQWKGKGKYKEPAAPDTTNLPGLPEGWAISTFDAIAKTASGGTPRRDKPSNYGGGIPWVKSGELGDSVVRGTEETISAKGLENSSAKIFPKGTLCIALYGATVGKLGLLGIDAATNQAVCGIFPSDGIDNSYLWIYLEAIREKLIRLGQGGAQPNISQEKLRELVVPIPGVTEQRHIVAEVDRRLSLLREIEVQVDANLHMASRLNHAILAGAFSGKMGALLQ